MKEWKIKQEIYHRLNPEHTDDLKNFDVKIINNIIDNAISYFKVTDIGWVYPAKSYVVGICYARWISEDFNEDFYEILNDQDLLHGNDPYFVKYMDDKQTYDIIIKEVGLNFDCSKGVIPDVKKYYMQEINY